MCDSLVIVLRQSQSHVVLFYSQSNALAQLPLPLVDHAAYPKGAVHKVHYMTAKTHSYRLSMSPPYGLQQP